MLLRMTRAVSLAGIVVALACASAPGHRVDGYLPPLRVSLREFVEERLAELGYDVTDIVGRSASTTFSAVKIRTGAEQGGLIYDWLHVTVTTSRLVTDLQSTESVRESYVEVRAESFAHGRERYAIAPTPGVIADAEAFVAALRMAPTQVAP
jgi:hypothetical protein